MTCIAAWTEGGRVYVGGDSAGSDGWRLVDRADEKVFRSGPYVIGFTSSFRLGQVLRYGVELPVPDTWDVNRFMVTRFIDAVRVATKAAGIAKLKDNVDSAGTFIVAWKDRLFEVEDDFQVGIPRCGFAAVGSGCHAATGALHALRGYPMEPRARVTAALEAAEALTATVRRPFVVMETEAA